jgi:hypothetical protein
MADPFKLPGSSYEELAKIVAAYSGVTGEVGPADIGKLVGVHQTTISRNNGFLSAIGLIEEAKGGKKLPTDLGRDLGRAIEHNLSDRVQELWRTVVSQSDFLQQLISAVRIRRGMDASSFISHVGYSAGLSKGTNTALGARTVLAILVAAGAVQSADGKIVAVTTAAAQDRENLQRRVISSTPSTSEPTVITGSTVGSENVDFTVVVQVNISVTPEELDGLGARLKREIAALRGGLEEQTGTDPVEIK